MYRKKLAPASDPVPKSKGEEHGGIWAHFTAILACFAKRNWSNINPLIQKRKERPTGCN
jgi:hypothetical protein